MSAKTGRIIRRLRDLGDEKIAAHSRRFFKTGRGEYGEGDLFLGIRVPALRHCAGEYRELSLEDTLELLKSPFHEARLLALLMLVAKYRATVIRAEQEAFYRSYMKHRDFINNWDLVDCSAEHIVGAHLYLGDRKPLYGLARSSDLWDRRIGIMSTFHFIKKEEFSDTMAIAEILLYDKEDLIHKAAGWMLREVGKRNLAVEERFLIKYHKVMPRTMLRYAIEKLPEGKRLAYLHGTK